MDLNKFFSKSYSIWGAPLKFKKYMTKETQNNEKKTHILQMIELRQTIIFID